MKKIFLFSIAFFVAMTTNAQLTFADDEGGDQEEVEPVGIKDRRKNVMSLGLKLGGNLSTMTTYKEVDLGQKSGFGFDVGAVIGARFGKHTKASDPGTGPIGVQLEVLYSLHTVRTAMSDNIKLSYLEVPVMFRYYFFQDLHVEAGICIAGMLSSSPERLTANLNEPWPGRNTVSIATGNFKGFDLRPVLGLGYIIPKTGLGLNARYYFGTSDLAENFPCKVSSFEFALSWSFNVLKF